MRIIALVTDFGGRDWFVGTMKGVILGLAPDATLIDLAHEVPAGDVQAGAFTLMASYRYFPKGTVHVAIVDPGVGSPRAAIAVQTADYFFVGPDNGVLSWALAHEEIQAIHRLQNERYFRRPVSHTFHGRDIFAPVAAHLSRGVALGEFGPAQADLVRLAWPRIRRDRVGIQGEVVWIDRFGNAITNLSAADLDQLGSRAPSVRVGKRVLRSIRGFYQAVADGQPVAVIGSSGFLEIAVNGGNAARALRLKVGTRVRAG